MNHITSRTITPAAARTETAGDPDVHQGAVDHDINNALEHPHRTVS